MPSGLPFTSCSVWCPLPPPDGLNVRAVVGSAAVAQQQEATVGGGNGHQTEQDVNGSPDGKHDEPVGKCFNF